MLKVIMTIHSAEPELIMCECRLTFGFSNLNLKEETECQFKKWNKVKKCENHPIVSIYRLTDSTADADCSICHSLHMKTFLQAPIIL